MLNTTAQKWGQFKAYKETFLVVSQDQSWDLCYLIFSFMILYDVIVSQMLLSIWNKRYFILTKLTWNLYFAGSSEMHQ